MRRLFWLLVPLALVTACAQHENSTTTLPSLPAARAATVSPSPQALYSYAANEGANTIAQTVIPGANGKLTSQLAPDYELPAGCSPRQAVLTNAATAMFVLCFGNGQILPLVVRSNFTLAHSAIAPATGDQNPTFMLVPQAGVPHVLYVDDGFKPGTLSAYAVSTAGIHRIAKYTIDPYPGGMALGVVGGTATLYVATENAIDTFAQNHDGTLVKGSPINVGGAMQLDVEGNVLVSTGPAEFAEFGLPSRKQLSVPPPPWVATGQGPVFPGSMTAMIDPAAATTSQTPATGYTTLFVSTSNYNATWSVYDPKTNTWEVLAVKNASSGTFTYLATKCAHPLRGVFKIEGNYYHCITAVVGQADGEIYYYGQAFGTKGDTVNFLGQQPSSSGGPASFDGRGGGLP